MNRYYSENLKREVIKARSMIELGHRRLYKTMTITGHWGSQAIWKDVVNKGNVFETTYSEYGRRTVHYKRCKYVIIREDVSVEKFLDDDPLIPVYMLDKDFQLLVVGNSNGMESTRLDGLGDFNSHLNSHDFKDFEETYYEQEEEEEIEIQYTEPGYRTETLYVYVMLDKNTGYYKIGKSINPQLRESTLQSEKPTIKMVHCFDAEDYSERYLHRVYKHKRIRGEWFDLDVNDLIEIKKYFINESN